MLNKFLTSILAVSLLTLFGLSTSMAGQRGGGGGGGAGGRGNGDYVDLVPLSGDEVSGLQFMREEEKVARDSYLTLSGIWGVTVFDNIAGSEQNHMDALKQLLDKYQLSDPVTDPVLQGVGEFVDGHLQDLYDDLMLWGKQSLMDGLYVGAAIEETDIIDIETQIDLADHADIITTYQTLMCGSRNHLRAFVRQIENNGGVYDPSDGYFLDSANYFLEIAHSPMERDCGTAY
jgi:hypothetical protein